MAEWIERNSNWIERYSNEPQSLSEIYDDLEEEGFEPEVSLRGNLGRLSPLRYESGLAGGSLSRSEIGDPTELTVDGESYEAVLSPLRIRMEISGDDEESIEEAYELLESLDSTYDVALREDLNPGNPHRDLGL